MAEVGGAGADEQQVSEVVEHRPASLVVVRIVRPKFVRKRGESPVLIAEPPGRARSGRPWPARQDHRLPLAGPPARCRSAAALADPAGLRRALKELHHVPHQTHDCDAAVSG